MGLSWGPRTAARSLLGPLLSVGFLGSEAAHRDTVGGLATFSLLLAQSVPKTPLQYTEWLLWTVFLMALAVGIVYILLLIWALARHISHEPLAQDRPVPGVAQAQKPSRGSP